MLKRLKTALAGLLMLAPLALFAQVPSDLPEPPNSPVVLVRMPDDSLASGVVISRIMEESLCKEEVLTVAHAVGMDYSPKEGRYWPAVGIESQWYVTSGLVKAYDHTSDLALVETWSPECMAEFAMPVSNTYIPHGTPIWAAGWLYGQELTIITGVVSHYRGSGWYDAMEGPYLITSASVKPGMSGGAIMQGRELHGIISGYAPGSEHWSVSVPAWRINQFLEKYRGSTSVDLESGDEGSEG